MIQIFRISKECLDDSTYVNVNIKVASQLKHQILYYALTMEKMSAMNITSTTKMQQLLKIQNEIYKNYSYEPRNANSSDESIITTTIMFISYVIKKGC